MLTTRLKVGSKVSAPLSLKGGLCRASQVVALVQVKQDQVAVASSTCSDVQQRAREGEAQCPSHAFFCCWNRGRTQGNANGVILERAAITIKALQGISTRIAAQGLASGCSSKSFSRRAYLCLREKNYSPRCNPEASAITGHHVAWPRAVAFAVCCLRSGRASRRTN